MTTTTQMPDELSPRHLRRRLLQLGALIAVILAAVLTSPGLGSLRDRLRDAAPAWLAAAVGLELLSNLSYVVIFRAVFCPRMSWQTSYQIGMAEQAANSLLPAGGAGGLALGAWALRRAGMPTEHIARRTVAFFLLTSLANLGALVVFAAGFALGLLGREADQWVTYGFGIASLAGILLTLALPALSERINPDPRAGGRLRRLTRRLLASVSDGVRDSISLLRTRSIPVLAGSLGYMAFDIAVLWACFRAFGHSPSFGVLVVGYIIGQLGGLLPIPGGIGGTEGGLVGAFVLYHSPLAAATVAVLAYRTVQLWLPAILGSAAFIQLRSSLHDEKVAGAMCATLTDSLEVVHLPVRA